VDPGFRRGDEWQRAITFFLVPRRRLIWLTFNEESRVPAPCLPPEERVLNSPPSTGPGNEKYRAIGSTLLE
jgi:hypothetical protein